ncbi:hypothetical protein VFPPC_11363 [Pochonia chlamydosporia 170]|uniref:Chromo domain-containing protein n=1 Tax=Pochonia chlamydosporia 170 TaxID=1380566 RepID=A0A179EXI9_METCM|nr:hypothetical protein VFPPC_11363 [Pochonia chlamydosporia 170]OAQ57905.2 hypothetical protein VFPPC_11363 [Pochonia chlamydosporia 170]
MFSSKQRFRLTDPAAVADRAKSRGWKADEHLENDKQRDLNKYDDKVKEKQDQVLHKYAIWHWDRSGRNVDFEPYKDVLLREGAPIPPIQELKDFWRFYKDQSVGRLRERPTAPTLKARAKEFKGGYMRMTGNLLNDEDTREINYWLKNVLPFEENSGVKDIVMPKYNYKPVDLDRHLDALYTRGDLGITHERTRFQFHLILLMFANTGARKGGLLTDGIKYKDIRLVLERTGNGGRRFIFGHYQRTVKNNKDPENNKFGATGREHKVLRYNAVFLLLLLAIADNALDRDDFVQILKGNGDGPIEWNAAALETPICRSVNRQGTVDDTKPMSEFVFLGIFKKLFMAEYDYSRASMHMIRREIGKQLDERYTEVERSQHLTQADKAVFGQSYVAFVSSCDGFAAFMREKPDHAAVEYFQGVSQFWQPGLPTKLPAALRDKINNHPDILELKREIKASGSIRSDKNTTKNQLNALRKRLERGALEEHRSKCFKEKRRDRLLRGSHRSADDDDDADPLNDLIPEKGRVAQAMIRTLPVDHAKQPGIMRDALLLLTGPGSVYYRPQEVPKNGLCPYCGLAVKSLPPRQRSQHIHRCRRKSTAETLGVSWTDLKFCYFCMAFYTREDWQEDCQNHLSHLKHCCSITYRHTLLRPAFCPLCKQTKDLPASDRLQYWERDADAIRHIEETHGWVWLCAECNFSCYGRQPGLYHLHDAHGYSISNAKLIQREIAESVPDSTTQLVAVDYNAPNGSNNFESISFLPSPAPDLPLEAREENFYNLHTMLDPQLLAGNDPCSDTRTDPSTGMFYESSTSDTASFWDDTCDMDPLDELMSQYITFPADAAEGGPLPSEVSNTGDVIDLTGDDKLTPQTTEPLSTEQHRPRQPNPGDDNSVPDHTACPAASHLCPLPTLQGAEGRASDQTRRDTDTLRSLLPERRDSNVVAEASEMNPEPEIRTNSHIDHQKGNNHQSVKQAVRIRLKTSSPAKVDNNQHTSLATLITAPSPSCKLHSTDLEGHSTSPKRKLIRLHRQKRLEASEDDESVQTEQPDRKRQKNNIYKVKRYLAVWGKIFLEWDDGTTGWEPKSNIIDKEELAKFQAEYQGIDEGVDILNVRQSRARAYQFLVHWHGRPDSEDRWVDEKYMNRDRIEEMKAKARVSSRASGQKRVRRSQ